jgi:hypothetical protein
VLTNTLLPELPDASEKKFDRWRGRKNHEA